MRFVTRLIAPAALWLMAASAAQGEALTDILRNAALKNGLRPAAQLFDDTDAHLAEFGRAFFESRHVSLNGNISCRNCHLDRFSSADGLPNAVGVLGKGKGAERALSDGRIVPRNTLPLWGRGAHGFETFFWDGKVDFANGKRISQFGEAAPSPDPFVTAVHLPPLEIREMLSDGPDIARYKRESPSSASVLYGRIVDVLNREERQAIERLARALGKPASQIEFIDVARSIAAFIRTEFALRDTKLHGFVFGRETLTPEELKGGLLFYGKGKCSTCHTGPYFSDFEFYAVPFPQLGFGKNGFGVDYGRFNVTFNPGDLYKFRTPPLFNVTRTAPYGHAGSLPDLKSAIVTHFDPLRSIDSTEMDAIARHEQFKRMAAVGDDYLLLSVLSDDEVELIGQFLTSLEFDP